MRAYHGPRPFLRTFAQLTSLQLERAQEHLHRHLQRDLLHQMLAEQPTSSPPQYPCRHATRIIHWGLSHGQQRFRCKECTTTFNLLDATALAGLHHKEKWAGYADCISRDLTLRTAAAKACDINLKTVFRWRHRFMRYALTICAAELSGIVEADEVFTPESFKGLRHLPQPDAMVVSGMAMCHWYQR